MNRNLVLDNTILSHFARADELAVLKALCVGFKVLIPTEVKIEISDGVAEYPILANALSLQWTTTIALEELPELIAFGRYHDLLGDPTHNQGESAVLAFVEVNGGIALVDETAGRRLGQANSLDVRGTLWLILEGFKAGVLTRESAEALVDALRATDMRLPIDGPGLLPWAYQHGVLP